MTFKDLKSMVCSNIYFILMVIWIIIVVTIGFSAILHNYRDWDDRMQDNHEYILIHNPECKICNKERK